MTSMTMVSQSTGSASDDVAALLDGAERLAHRKFFHRKAMELVIRQTETKKQLRDDFFFLATFVANASQVLDRQGQGSSETENLSREFSSSLEKVHELLRTIVKDADEESKRQVISGYLTLSQECLVNMIALAREIAWVKSYETDRKGI